MSVKCEIKQYNALKKDLERMQKAPKTVLKRTMSDVKTRVPGWIAAEITNHYGVKKAEITGNKIGSVKVKGDSIETVEIVYRGRLLTPTHFNMKPKAPNVGGSYNIKATIVKGQTKKIGGAKKLTKKQRANIGKNFTRQGTRNSPQSPWMLQTTGNTKANGTDYIPFQRQEQPGKMDHVFRTLSLPQMVTGRAAEDIHTAINEKLGARLEHHMKLMEK